MNKLAATIGLGLAWLLAAPASAKTIYVYQDGVRCPLEVPDDFEFYTVECEDIRVGNRDVINGGCIGQPSRMTLGASHASEGPDTAGAEHYGRHGSGVWVGDYRAQRLLGPASWQGIEGEYIDQRDWNLRLDQSTSHINFDDQIFMRRGYVYGLNNAGAVTRATRNKQFFNSRTRFGSMDGGVWRIDHTYMETDIGPGNTQANDHRFQRTAAGFRAVECGWLLDAELYYGKYSSDSALIANSFSGARADGRYELDARLAAGMDAEVTRIDVGLDNKTVTRSNAAGRLDWDAADGLTLSGEVRRVDEANDVVITSHLKGYTDVGGAVEYAPNSAVRLSADYRHREADGERIKLEDPEIYNWYFGNSPAQRSDLDAIRVDTKASGDFFNLRGRVRFDASWQLSANYSRVDWSELPEAGVFSGGQSLQPSYFADGRRSAAIRLARDYGGGGQLVLDASDLQRTNDLRDAEFGVRRYGVAYSAPLWDCERYSVGLSRSERVLDLAGNTQDWDSDSWNFDAGLSGAVGWADYRVNYTRYVVEGALAGDYNALGLELQLHESPLAISAWWRERADGPAGGFANYADIGLRLGYSVALD